MQHLNSFLHPVPESLNTFEQFLNSFISAHMRLRDDFIEVIFLCSILFSTTGIHTCLRSTEVLLTEMRSTWLKELAERVALSPFLYCDFPNIFYFCSTQVLRQTGRCVCIFCVVSGIPMLLYSVLSLELLELAAKGKDEMYGKHCVPRSLLDFPDSLPSTAACVN